jgi:hypothetical protein
MKLRDPVPNFHIHGSVCDLYIPTDTWYMNVEIGNEAALFHFYWNICSEISVRYSVFAV